MHVVSYCEKANGLSATFTPSNHLVSSTKIKNWKRLKNVDFIGPSRYNIQPIHFAMHDISEDAPSIGSETLGAVKLI